jgi:hypothetical protein
VTDSSATKFPETLAKCAEEVEAIYAQCASAHPNFGVTKEDLAVALAPPLRSLRTVPASRPPSIGAQVARFINELQHADVYLALDARVETRRPGGEFDRRYRSFIDGSPDIF